MYTILLRICISCAAVIVPVIFLSKGIYGSFVFTFSIPVLWQVGLRGMPFHSLGLRRAPVGRTIAMGFLSGCLMGTAAGFALRWLGITGRLFSDLHAVRLAFGPWSISFPLRNELSYRLLGASHGVIGLCSYLAFSIFVIGLGEELFWRGFIQQKINRYLSTSRAILVTSILFSLIHCYIFSILDLRAGAIFLLLIAIAGGVWGYLFSRYTAIWAPVFSHGVAAFILWKYFFFV